MTAEPFIISPSCLQSYPCKHYVTNTKTGKKTLMGGVDILRMLNNAGLSDAHFNQYKSRLDKPT